MAHENLTKIKAKIAAADGITLDGPSATALAAKEAALQSAQASIAEKDGQIASLTAQVEALTAQIAEKDAQIATLTAQVEALDGSASDESEDASGT